MRTTRLASTALIAALALSPSALLALQTSELEDPTKWSANLAADNGHWQVEGGTAVGEGHAWLHYVGPDGAFIEWRDLEVSFDVRLQPGAALHINQREGDDRVFAGLSLDDNNRPWIHIQRGHPGELVYEPFQPDFGGTRYAVTFASVGDTYRLTVSPIPADGDGESFDFPAVAEVSIEDGPESGPFAFEIATGLVEISSVNLTGERVEPTTTTQRPRGWDLEVHPPTISTPDSNTIRIETRVVNHGPESAAGADLEFGFEGVMLEQQTIEPGLEPGDDIPLAIVASVPDRLAGTSGTVTAILRPDPGDLSEDNNRWQRTVRLPNVAVPPPPTDPNGVPPWVPPTIIVTVVVAGGGTWNMRRRWRRDQERRAQPDGPDGRCQPGEGCSIHDLEPDLKARKITGITLSRQVGDEVARKTVDEDGVLGPLKSALRSARDKQREYIADAAKALFWEIDSWPDGRRSDPKVTVAGSYEGSSGSANLKHFKCTDHGRWPDFDKDKPKQTWKGTVTDQATIPLGDLIARDRESTVDELTAMLVDLVHQVSELRSPLPKGLATKVDVS